MTKDDAEDNKPKSPAAELRERIIKRAALEFKNGMYGILPKLCGIFLTTEIFTQQFLPN